MGEYKLKVKDDAESIKQKAYEIWEKEGRKPGHDLENWLKAENTVHSQQNFHQAEKRTKGLR